MDNIAIVGSSGHAKVIIDIVEQERRFNISGFLDDYRTVANPSLGHSILGGVADLPNLIEQYNLKGAIVAIGDNFARSEVVTRIKQLCPELPFVSSIHPSASIARGITIGAGSMIMAGVSISPGSSIGNFCILNTNCSLDHDSALADFSSLGPGTTTGGNCKIGAYSAIGIGAVLTHGTSIGEHTVVGAGSLVMKSIDSFVVAYGTPAKVIKPRKPGAKYL